MQADFKKEVDVKMKKTLEALQTEFSKLRTGRASSSLLDHVIVSYYGKDVPLNQVATVSVSDARTLMISPWDKGMLAVIEKAILTAELGLNPVTAGTVIRVPMPPLSEERRKEKIKIARAEAENSRVAIRNSRRDANTQLKEKAKKKLVTEDEERRIQDEIQKVTDHYIKEIDKVLGNKETDLMEV